MAESILKLQNLKRLWLSNNLVGDEMLKQILRHSTIQDLTVYFNQAISDEAFRTIDSNRALRRLLLIHITVGSFSNFGEFLAANKSLTHLKINMGATVLIPNFSRENVHHILSMQNLKRFSLNHCGRIYFGSLAPLATNHSLKHLELSDFLFVRDEDDEESSSTLSNIYKNRNITSLNFYHTAFTNKQVKVLATETATKSVPVHSAAPEAEMVPEKAPVRKSAVPN